MSSVPRTPPKFVPTLTEVVHLESSPAQPSQLSEQIPHQSGESMLYSEFSGQGTPTDSGDEMPRAIVDGLIFGEPPPAYEQPWKQHDQDDSSSEPPYAPPYAPQNAAEHSPQMHHVQESPQATQAPVAAPDSSNYDLSPELQEQIVHRVMQRVDLSLEMRLREAVASVMLDQTRNLVPRLREEIEWVVRQSVAEAMAAELERGI